MKIELTRTPRYKDAEDDFCIWDVSVNGVCVGTWYGGKDKKYLDKEKWAKEMIPKRLVVVGRNIDRLTAELESWHEERRKLLDVVNDPSPLS